MASGSVNELPEKVTLPATWSRRAPNQHEPRPVTRRFPPMVLSS